MVRVFASHQFACA